MDKTKEAINRYFPVGDKRRGDAMIIAGIANLQGREDFKTIILKNLGKKNEETKKTKQV